MLAGFLGHFFRKKELREFEALLKLNGCSKCLNAWFRENLLFGVALFLLSFGVLLSQGADDLLVAFLPLAFFFIPLAFGYFWQVYRFEQRKKGIEQLVPDVLLQASIFPKGSDFIKTIEYLSGAGYGALSIEFGKALLEIRKGAPIEEALENIKKRNRSASLDRAINLLIQGYRSGADMGKIFKEAADDLLETNALLRERVSTMVVEKYTLLFAGGLLVPAILGLLVGMVSRLDFTALSVLEIGLDAVQRKELLDAALLANKLYIAEYALLASLFVANQEGNAKKALLYALALFPLSFIAYTCAQAL
ncbi:MAG: type II secretion system F family protein [Candidatus Diapherotrites archaeon]